MHITVQGMAPSTLPRTIDIDEIIGEIKKACEAIKGNPNGLQTTFDVNKLTVHFPNCLVGQRDPATKTIVVFVHITSPLEVFMRCNLKFIAHTIGGAVQKSLRGTPVTCCAFKPSHESCGSWSSTTTELKLVAAGTEAEA